MCVWVFVCILIVARGKYARLTCLGAVTSLSSAGGWGRNPNSNGQQPDPTQTANLQSLKSTV